jgi:hypothetical protein
VYVCHSEGSKHIDAVVAKMEGKSVYNKAMLCLNTINKAGPTGPRLLFTRVFRCHKKGLRKIAIGSEQGRMVGP